MERRTEGETCFRGKRPVSPQRCICKEESRKFPGEGTRFVVSGEISSIYKKNGKTRKVHNVILLPSLEAADAMAQRLEKSEIFTQMVVRFLVWTVMIFWK